ncbi:hypothetical protein K435DRAFT_847636 [Dendrothele bispora CBS 962.96]|uniref:Uncharacterized protein n=1 Tax=Dendrothele bispora (strain CBS 962.96) TaxID=1314807 RepID=A0A4S8MWU6_DENBC|nr:hypothetical protein K435DRAFT_847636 [Dendrothele bispora CBS 962.96]
MLSESSNVCRSRAKSFHPPSNLGRIHRMMETVVQYFLRLPPPHGSLDSQSHHRQRSLAFRDAIIPSSTFTPPTPISTPIEVQKQNGPETVYSEKDPFAKGRVQVVPTATSPSSPRSGPSPTSSPRRTSLQSRGVAAAAAAAVTRPRYPFSSSPPPFPPPTCPLPSPRSSPSQSKSKSKSKSKSDPRSSPRSIHSLRVFCPSEPNLTEPSPSPSSSLVRLGLRKAKALPPSPNSARNRSTEGEERMLEKLKNETSQGEFGLEQHTTTHVQTYTSPSYVYAPEHGYASPPSTATVTTASTSSCTSTWASTCSSSTSTNTTAASSKSSKSNYTNSSDSSCSSDPSDHNPDTSFRSLPAGSGPLHVRPLAQTVQVASSGPVLGQLRAPKVAAGRLRARPRSPSRPRPSIESDDGGFPDLVEKTERPQGSSPGLRRIDGIRQIDRRIGRGTRRPSTSPSSIPPVPALPKNLCLPHVLVRSASDPSTQSHQGNNIGLTSPERTKLASRSDTCLPLTETNVMGKEKERRRKVPAPLVLEALPGPDPAGGFDPKVGFDGSTTTITTAARRDESLTESSIRRKDSIKRKKIVHS